MAVARFPHIVSSFSLSILPIPYTSGALTEPPSRPTICEVAVAGSAPPRGVSHNCALFIGATNNQFTANESFLRKNYRKGLINAPARPSSPPLLAATVLTTYQTLKAHAQQQLLHQLAHRGRVLYVQPPRWAWLDPLIEPLSCLSRNRKRAHACHRLKVFLPNVLFYGPQPK